MAKEIIVKAIVYKVYSPDGVFVRAYDNRDMAKAFLDGINFNIPSWHYNELYKMAAEVVEG